MENGKFCFRTKEKKKQINKLKQKFKVIFTEEKKFIKIM